MFLDIAGRLNERFAERERVSTTQARLLAERVDERAERIGVYMQDVYHAIQGLRHVPEGVTRLPEDFSGFSRKDGFSVQMHLTHVVGNLRDTPGWSVPGYAFFRMCGLAPTSNQYLQTILRRTATARHRLFSQAGDVALFGTVEYHHGAMPGGLTVVPTLIVADSTERIESGLAEMLAPFAYEARDIDGHRYTGIDAGPVIRA